MNPKVMTGEEMLARVLYRDGLMLVVDKPAGLSVHRGPKGGASLEDFFAALRFGLPRDPALAHRLDRETSGCLVLGRHRKALAHLGLLFKHRKVGKTYWAVVEGGPAEDEGTIDLALGRLDETRGWWMKPDPKGVPAVTQWRVMGRKEAVAPPPQPSPTIRAFTPVFDGLWGEGAHRPAGERGASPTAPHATSPLVGEVGVRSAPGGGLTWLALEPITGRTHQLRVHCAALGFPIVGDAIYGTQASLRRLRNEKFLPRAGGPPLQLHAREVVVPISKNKPAVRVTAPVPGHLCEQLAMCGWKGE